MKQRTKDLIEKAQCGDKNAIEALLVENTGLIASVAKKYVGHGVDLEDLIQEGYIGFMRGIEKFDLSAGNELSTYMYWWLTLACNRCLENSGAAIRIPAGMYQDTVKLKKFQANFIAEHGAEPSLEDYAETGFGDARIKRTLWFITNVQTLASLDMLMQPGESDSEISEFVYEPEAGTEDCILNQEMRRTLKNVMHKALTPKQRNILVMHLGLDGNKELPLSVIARQYGISKERVRQIEVEALAVLRRTLSRSKYQDMFVI